MLTHTLRKLSRAQRASLLSVRSKKKTRSYATGLQKVSIIPGDGIGKEISVAVQEIFEKAKVPIEWELAEVSAEKGITDQALKSLQTNKVGLKGPLGTPIGVGHKSLNLGLRKALKLYANVRPCLSVPGVKTKYDNVDIVIIRENTEGYYSGIEHMVVPGVAQCLKLITAEASWRVAKYAFEFAVRQGRKKVSAVHKATVLALTDGLFLDCAKEVSLSYPNIQYEAVNLDNMCMQTVMNPNRFDVLLLTNLYGDIASDLGAGLIGGLGLTPSGNIGDAGALFEAVHGTAPDIAGKNKANPTALLLSAVMMLRHMGLHDYAKRIESATLKTLAQGTTITGDLGGKASCTEYTQAIISNL
eukprot:TRINITY_DN24_c0_g1_i1.p1 TRINITY_DN24_c0_g1~~TRINITY_DN24_c0_g1_i1.p1  ORF type:complete len:358 (+),score=69.78 TRINITY_DN24_c0_g1_i1:102-1175(+)